ncbi:hypothetical protein AAVH_41002 [Aphelenchoides avenae]|nr:hypothetical protein AAVH_41002 [Aphelenchus avenae]
MDTVEFLVAAARLQKLSLFITLVSFTQNYARIFDAASKTTVKYLYMDIFREFGARKQPEEAQLEPATFLAIKERWLDFVFTSLCDHAIALIRHSLPAGLPCPFSPNDIVRKFLDMDRVDHFTTCVIDGATFGPLETCTALVATRQSFVNNGFMRQLNRSVGNGLYNVYYVRNERANETLSVLVGNTAAGIRVILMRGAFECGEEVPYPSRQDGEGDDDYEEDNDDEEEEDDEVDHEGEEEGDEGTEEEDAKDDRDNNTTE